MGRTTRTYAKVDEATDMIQRLCEKYPDVFWAIRPEQITVMGVDNVERSDNQIAKNPIWSSLRTVKGVEKAVFIENNIGIRQIIEIFWSDWNRWRDSLKLAVLAENLLAITPEVEKRNRPDTVGFHILYKALGLGWKGDDGSNIPNMLTTDVEFDLELRPGLDEVNENEGDELLDGVLG